MASIRPRSFAEYAQILWRRKWLILFIGATMLIATFLVIREIPNVYESRASVVVAARPEERHAVAARVAAISEGMISRSFLADLIQRHNLGSADGSVSDAAINRIRKNIAVDTKWRDDRPEKLAISYRHTDPVIAKTVATDLVSLFGKMNQDIENQTTGEAEAVQTEIAQIETRLDEISRERMAASERRSIMGRAFSVSTTARAQRAAAASSLATLTDKQYALEQQIAEQKAQIAEQEKIARSAASDARASSSYGVLLVRKAELEAQLKDYSAQYTDKNPKVAQTRNQLAEINRQIAQLSTGDGSGSIPANSAEARELRSLNRELARLKIELGVVQREIARKSQVAGGETGGASLPAPVVASTAASESTPEKQAELDRLRSRYEILLKRQDTLKSLQISPAGFGPGLFQVVDAPAVPQLPVAPNRSKLKLMAAALSLGVALLVVALLELPRLFVIRDDRDVEYYLDAPVLALIPEVTTASERTRSQKLLVARGLGVL
ncbi:MAG TPA: Wzz/FepE/Etk N-terminal domain-containing protein, partial [Blastocatellia bacterium]|nr:Wzz/FepE/Etk N-terminal domain-containing protein [Blastocatellia bacterium]